MASNEIINKIYAGIVNAETTGLEGLDAFIRTKVYKTKGGSTAYGPAQLTGSLVKDKLKQGSIPEDLKEYVTRFIKQSEQFNKYGNRAKKFGKDHKPRYDYGGSGDLTSPQDQKDYKRLAKHLLSQQYDKAIKKNDPNPVETVTNGWRFGVNSDKTIKENDPGYGKRFAEVFTGEEIKVADTSDNFAERYMRRAENEIESLYGKRPEEVIKETETVIKETPNFYANQNITDIPRDGTYTLPPDQIITPLIRETIEEDVTVQPIRTGNIEMIEKMPYQRSENERMQEAARRSMMQGNTQDRMNEYEFARFDAQEDPRSYAQGASSYALPPMQAAQRMMGGGMGYAQGGTVDQAQGLASLGRGGDSTLVHMQPREVAGLQQLAQANGTSLTRNPMTGYPEAFSLKGALKAAAPIAAGYFAGPAGFAGMSAGTGSAIAAGALTGAGVAAATGDDPILGAVTGGMGGYSGMGLESAVANMPAATVPMSGNMGQQIAADAAYTGSLGGMQVGTPTANIGAGGTGMNVGGGGFGAQGSAVNDPMLLAGSKPGGTIMQDSPLSTFDRAIAGAKKASGTTDFINRYDKLPGGGFEQASKFTPGTTPQALMKLGSPLASVGIGGLEESDFIVKPDFNDPRDEYDPYSRLKLSGKDTDTGINEALAKDTGLRLFDDNRKLTLAQGGMISRYEEGGEVPQGEGINLSTTSEAPAVDLGGAGITNLVYGSGLNINSGLSSGSPLSGKPRAPHEMKLVDQERRTGGTTMNDGLRGFQGQVPDDYKILGSFHTGEKANYTRDDRSGEWSKTPYHDDFQFRGYDREGNPESPWKNRGPKDHPNYSPATMTYDEYAGLPSKYQYFARRPALLPGEVDTPRIDEKRVLRQRANAAEAERVRLMDARVAAEAAEANSGVRLLAKGGYLQGPGDGMSDDIPATINGNEPAALADGEFVIPADVVSHLGNGSSKAGSKQLHAMMDRIRKARTGRKSQGKEIKPGKYMPT